MELDDNILNYLSFVFTVISTICLMYISYKALIHTAKPKIRITLLNKKKLASGNTINFKFHIQNIGHWYGKPIAKNITIYCNFDPEFKLQRMKYGSRQELVDDIVKKGARNMLYFKATGIHVGKGKEGERFFVECQTPKKQGNYSIRVEAFSENGVSYSKKYKVTNYQPSE